MTAFLPTPEHIANWQFFSQVLLGVVAVLLATFWLLDRGLDLVSPYVLHLLNRKRDNVIDFTEAQRRRVLDAVVRR